MAKSSKPQLSDRDFFFWCVFCSDNLLIRFLFLFFSTFRISLFSVYSISLFLFFYFSIFFHFYQPNINYWTILSLSTTKNLTKGKLDCYSTLLSYSRIWHFFLFFNNPLKWYIDINCFPLSYYQFHFFDKSWNKEEKKKSAESFQTIIHLDLYYFLYYLLIVRFQTPITEKVNSGLKTTNPNKWRSWFI